MAAPGRRMDVQLSDEEYERLESLAEKRDTSVDELIRQAIRQVYMSDLERDLTPLEVRRLDETSFLVGEEEEVIGIRGSELVPRDEERSTG
jgi:predicted transcriptional regulator